MWINIIMGVDITKNKMVTIYTKTKKQFDIVLESIRKKSFPRKITFKDSWNRFKEETCIVWEEKGRDVYCSYYSFCVRYPEDFFTFETFLLYLKGEIKRGLYYGGYINKLNSVDSK